MPAAPFPWDIVTDVERDFLARVRPLDPEFPVLRRGIWTSELFALCVWLRRYGVYEVVESGVASGQSTIVLGRFLEPESGLLWSIDREDIRERVYPRLPDPWRELWQPIVGDGLRAVPEILDVIARESDGPVAVLLDGPKDTPAVALAERCLRDFPLVAFVAIHDMYQPAPPRPRAVRDMLARLPYPTWCSDDPAFVRRYNLLDGGHHAGWLDEEGHGKLLYSYVGRDEAFELVSYGPTLAVITR